MATRDATTRRATTCEATIRCAVSSALATSNRSDEKPVVVGASGGIDSMVLSHALAASGTPGVLVHVNYGLRAGADADAALVRSWAQAHVPEWPVVIHEAEALTGNTQDAARRLRYDLLHRVAVNYDSSTVWVAHHQRDQVETLLLHLLRGTGPRGLAGMPRVRPIKRGADVQLVRPLLHISKAAIQAYAKAHDVPYRVDPTNQSDRYARNRIRNEVLPLLADIASDAETRIADAAQLMRAYVDEHWQPQVTAQFDAAYDPDPTGGRLSLVALREASPVVRTALIRMLLERAVPEAPRTQAVAQAVAQLVDAQVGRRVEVGEAVVWRTRTHLRLVADAPEVPEPHPVFLDGTPVLLSTGTLRCTRHQGPLQGRLDRGPHQIVGDAGRVHPPVTIRPWTPGDRIQPLGMKGHKPVSDILTEGKVAPPERPYQLVVEDRDRILWVVGYRMHEALRVTASTNEYVIMQWQPV